MNLSHQQNVNMNKRKALAVIPQLEHAKDAKKERFFGKNLQNIDQINSGMEAFDASKSFQYNKEFKKQGYANDKAKLKSNEELLNYRGSINKINLVCLNSKLTCMDKLYFNNLSYVTEYVVEIFDHCLATEVSQSLFNNI